MRYTLRWLQTEANNTTREVRPGKWVPARPMWQGPLRWRLREAWDVIRGRADTFTWPEDESDAR